jgi:hypothetical protein
VFIVRQPPTRCKMHGASMWRIYSGRPSYVTFSWKCCSVSLAYQACLTSKDTWKYVNVDVDSQYTALPALWAMPNPVLWDVTCE